MTQDTLTFFLKMKDLASSGITKFATTAKKTFDAVDRASKSVVRGNNAIARSYDYIRNKISAVSAKMSELRKKASQPISSSGLVGSLKGALPIMGLAGALTLGGSMLTSGLKAQARKASFEVMAGKQAGGSLNNQLTKYAQDSIYGNEVYANAQTMLAFGASDKDIMADTKMLGDVAMGNAERLKSLTLAFSQVRAGAKLTGQDLLQFVNAGFNPLQQIAEKTGASMASLRKKMSDGEISFDMVKQAFVDATSEGGKFFGMTNKIAQTDFGKWEAFKGQVDGLIMKIGGGLAPAWGSLITNVLVPFVDLLSGSVDFVKQYSDWFVILGAGILAYAGYVGMASAGTGLWTAAQWALNIAMSANPIGLVVAGIAALVVGVVMAWRKFEGFRMVVMGLWEAFKQVFSNISSLFKKVFSPIMEAITAFKEGRYADAAKALGKQVFNLTPVGMYQAVKDGGLTKGVADAYKKGSLMESIRSRKPDEIGTKNTPASLGGVAAPSNAEAAQEAVKGVVRGGARVININGVKLIENLQIHANNMDESIEELEEKLQMLLLRILNSAAAVQ